MCDPLYTTVVAFWGAVIAALLSIAFVWFGKKKNISYYNALLGGWFLYFIFYYIIGVIEARGRTETKIFVNLENLKQ